MISKENTNDGNLVQTMNPEVKDVTNDVQNEGVINEDETKEANITTIERDREQK